MCGKEWERVKGSVNDMSQWRAWGPYVSDRAWGTVREDYSETGDAWNFLTHELARSNAFRWGEDGIAAICDRFQLLVLAPAFWNGRDPILKERLFGLTPFEGNHGEDVKEYYFHLDNTPTHSYMKFLLKYPQLEFPYEELVVENQKRNGQGFEFELLDTEIFRDNRYFDIYIEYAKNGPHDICVRIEAVNRFRQPADLHILPQLWFRNIWSRETNSGRIPVIEKVAGGDSFATVKADNSMCQLPDSIPGNYSLNTKYLHLPVGGNLLFTDNESNPNTNADAKKIHSIDHKDAFHKIVVEGDQPVHNSGSKFAAHYQFSNVPPAQSVVLRFRLNEDNSSRNPLGDVDEILRVRKLEADQFYDDVCNATAPQEEKAIQRAALSGLLWTKQNYIFDVNEWLNSGEPKGSQDSGRKQIRNQHWQHLNSMRILTMPDKWEYPWFAAWDLAFHCVSFALVDPNFAKEQLELMLFEQFQHPNGQIPAYEWEFSDVNPPVHAWAVWKVFNMEKFRFGNADYDFLERCFHKLLINFTWWTNKVDRDGNNVFEGGFLGLDNITLLDRSEPMEGDVLLEQADATGWMAMFAQQMMRMALALAKRNPVYEAMATKFFQHYIYIAAAMKKMGPCSDWSLWDEEDGFFYDVLRYPDGSFDKFRVRSLVGLIPLFAVERLEARWIEPFTEFKSNFDWFVRNRSDLVQDVVHTIERKGEVVHVLTVANQQQLSRVLERVWDEDEFLSPYGIRSLSKFHAQHPFEFNGKTVGYEPAEAVSKLKGGNSNWRGPIWFPTNYMLIDCLRRLGKAFGGQLQVSPPYFKGKSLSPEELAADLAQRLVQIFKVDEDGQRPFCGGCDTFGSDPFWKELPLFHEYFHGDNGAGLGASHQTGWTALVANVIDEWC